MDQARLCEIVSRKFEGANKLVDIGCGDGYLVSCLAKKLGRKIVGLDTALEGFVRAHNQCRRFGVCDLIECVKGDAHDMKMFGSNEFDAVLLAYSLHHMAHPDAVLKEAKRILRPKGKIVVVEYVVRKNRSKCHRFVKKEINDMMKSSGFRNTFTRELEEALVLAEAEK